MRTSIRQGMASASVPALRRSPRAAAGPKRDHHRWVAALGLADGGREASFDRVALLAARALNARAVVLAFLTERGASVRGAAVLADSETAPAIPGDVLRAVVETDQPARLSGDEALGGHAWLAVPVRDRAAHLLGVLAAVDAPSRLWSNEEVHALEEAALTLLADFDLRAAGAELSQDSAPWSRRRSSATPQALAQRLRLERSHFTSLLEALADGVLLVNHEGTVVHCNKAFHGLFGLRNARPLVGLSSMEAFTLYRPQFLEPESVWAQLQKLEEGQTASLRELLPLGDGRVLERDYAPLVAAGQPQGHLWLYRDVTEREKARNVLGRQRDVGSLSHVDELTGLHNRRGFIGLARAQLDEAVRAQRTMLVIFSDLDGLKQINDRWGHQAGDRALLEFATLLRATFRERDLVARLGGDEFVVLVTDASAVGAEELVARLRSRIEQHNARSSRDFTLAFSTGVSTFDSSEPEPLEVLLSQADRRMYAEKRRKKDAPES